MWALRLNLTSPTKGSELKINLQCYWESCQAIHAPVTSKVLGHSRRIVSNCSITDCSPLYFSRCLPGRVHHVPGTGTGDSRNITRHHPGLWLGAGGGPTDQWEARTRERRAVAWSVAAGWDHPSDARLQQAGDSWPARPLKNGCKSSGGPTWDDLSLRPAASGVQGREQYFGPPHWILIVDECRSENTLE